MHKRRFLIILITALLVFTMTTGLIFAKTNQDKLSDVKNQQQSAESEKNDVEDEIADVQAKLQKLNTKISETQQEIYAKQERINTLNTRIEAKEEELKSQEEDLSDRLRTMYKTGSVGYLDIFLDSENFTELMNNISMIQRIHKCDCEVLGELEKAHESLQADKDSAEAVRQEMEEEKKTLEKKQGEVKKLESSLESRAGEIQARIDAFAQEAQSLNAQIQKEQEERARAEAEARARAAAAAAAAQTSNEGSQSAPTESTSSSEYYGGNGVLIWPVGQPRWVTSEFGRRPYIMGIPGSSYHNAIDIAVAMGTPVYAAASGYVMSSTGFYPQGYGWGVFIDHGNGLSTVYGHNNSICVQPGQYVEQGQVIAYCGMTGWATGPHVHFEVRENGVCVNPRNYLGY